MKKFISYVLISSLFLGTALVSYAADISNLPQKTHTQKLELLFVMQADHATITKTSDGFKLTLNDVNGKTLYFSNRPLRKAGSLSTERFMNNWIRPSSSFQQVPPNAAIIFDEMPIDKDAITRAKALKLEDPIKNSDHSWSFKVSGISGKLTPGSYTKISLFIDAYNITSEDITSIGGYLG